MKKKVLLPILLLATMSLGGGLVACNPAQSSSGDQTQSAYKVAIDNKAALEGEWYEGDSKDLELTLTPEANPLQELQNKNLSVTSSDESVVKVTGLGLSALKAGTAKITVDYRGAKEEVNITILSKSAKAKYGTAHEGTAEDPFTNEDALLVTKSAKYENEDYYVRGEIASWYHTPGERTDGVVSYFLKPATAGGEQFEVYKCLKEDGKALSETEIWKGGIATAHGTFTKYGEQCETTSAKFLKCEGTAPGARQVVNSTVAEVLTVGKALVDGDSEYNFYNITGYVVKKSGTSYFLADTKAVAEDSKDMFQIYNATAEGLDAKLLENAKITIKAVIKNYHGQVETCLPVAAADVTVVEEGQQWAVPEPAVTAKTIAEFKALENNKKAAYTLKATIKAFKNGDEKDKYGNMTLTDGTNDLAIYGSSATATALAWDNAEAYAFTNPQDFLTNDVTKDLKVGDEITMKLIRSDYVKDGVTQTIQGQGIITAVTAPDAPEVVSLAKYTFKTQTEGNTRSIDAATATNVFQKAADDAVFDEVKEVTNIYEGASGGSGDNAFSVFDVLKIGKSKAAGSIKIATKVDVTKVVIKGVSWTQTASLTVNGVTVNEAFKANIISKATIADGKITNAGTLEFEFAAAKEITISNDNTNANANFGIVFTEIEFYGPKASGGETPAAPVKSWDAAAIKTAIAGGTAAEVTGKYTADSDETFTAYKISTAGMTVTLTVNSEAAQHVKLQLKLATKFSNISKCGIWWQLPNNQSGLDKVVQKTQVSLGTNALPVPEEKSLEYTSIASYNPVQSPDAKDGSSALSAPVWVDMLELDLAAGDNTIEVKYLDGGYSYWVAGAQLVK